MNPWHPGDGAGAESTGNRASSDARYRHLVESAHDWVWEVDADARYTYSSPRVTDILGYRPEEVIGRTPFDLMPPGEADRVRTAFEAIAATRQPFSRLENVNCHRDGSLVVLETNGVPVLDPAGRLTGYRGWDRDVTERRRAEQTLRQSEERYRLMFESNPLPMWVFDIDTLQVLAANEEATRRYGYSADEFRSMTLRDLRPPEDVPALIEMTRGLDAESPSQADLVRHRRRDGTIMDVEVTGHGIGFEGRSARLVVVRDVTERLALERQLRQAQKMDAVGRLAGGIAHDFNNLLTAILGYSDLLLAGQGAGDGSEELREIKAAAERASRLTRQLLAFSRKEVSRREHVDLASLLDRMGSMLRRLLPENIALRIVAETPGPVTADSGQLEQVVLNLVVNSRDAMPGGGTITIRLAERGDAVELAVEDTGTGMDEKTMERVFEPFFTTKSPERGTGLGLSTLYGIVKQHAGDVQVRSQPGAGSTFTVSLPRENGTTAATAASPAASTGRPGTGRILLAEDDPAVRRLAATVLRRHGYDVVEAPHATAALDACVESGTPFELLVTDVVMPGMSGTTLAAEVRRRQGGVEVLFVSGHHDDTIGGQLGEPGAADFLRKPFSPQGLLDAVRAALERHGA